MEPRRVKIYPAIENFSPTEKSKKGTWSVANMTLMDQKSVTEEGYAVTASEIDMNFKTVTVPYENKIVVETSGSETEFTENKRNGRKKSSFSIVLPKLLESVFIRKNAFIKG